MAENHRQIVVIAGGTGGVGRHIVQGIVAADKYTVKVFTRQSSSSTLDIKGVEIIVVDYFNHAQLVRELQGVHTVIVCLISDEESSLHAQLNLLNACLEAKVKRFAPSEWAGISEQNTVIQLYRQLKVPVMEQVQASGIEYTLFTNGVFMEYFASPQRASDSLPPIITSVDFNAGEANLIGTGDEPFCVTSVEDVGRFVAAALELDRWEERSSMMGSRVTWNELIRLGEKIRRKEFHVQRTTIDEAKKNLNPHPEDLFTNFVQELYLGICAGEFNYSATLEKQIKNSNRSHSVHTFVYSCCSLMNRNKRQHQKKKMKKKKSLYIFAGKCVQNLTSLREFFLHIRSLFS